MTNSEIAEIVEFTGKLLDLHDKDEMRAKTYISSVYNLERQESNLSELSESDLIQIRGIGKTMSNNILEIAKTGTLKELEDLIELTPKGIFAIFKIKGLGVKKIKILWHDMNIDNVEDLKIACENGSIANQKGFGLKTQESILEEIAFIKENEGKLKIDKARQLSSAILDSLQSTFEIVEEVGQIVRNCQTVDLLHFLVQRDGFGGLKLTDELFVQDLKDSSPNVWRGKVLNNDIPISIEKVSARDWSKRKFINNSSENHLKFENEAGITLLNHVNSQSFDSELELYKAFGFNYIVPEMREGMNEFKWIKSNKNEDLITYEDLVGTVHNHSTYSDGKNTLKEMADFCQSLGFQYFGIADHSQSAQYAGGLRPEEIIKQHVEIDILNAAYKDFKILKGIESDILTNGDLDYEHDVLKSFDYVVASVHSGLNMDLQKASSRLIKAIENPYTSILGHLSGRLLLSRKSYPLDYVKIIDACAANNVAMEFNASPYRLDIDWKYIDLCVSKGVWISINPDAHTLAGVLDMKYGVDVTRKSGLMKNNTLNTLSKEQIIKVFKK